MPNHYETSGFIGGALFGGGTGLTILQTAPMQLIYEFPIKMIFVIVLSFLGGIVGMMAKDLYTSRLKDWWNNKIRKK